MTNAEIQAAIAAAYGEGHAYVSYTSNLLDKNSQRKVFELITTNIYISSANYHTYDWNAETSQKRFGELVRGWKKNAQKFDTSIIFDSSNRASELNDFHDALEYDILHATPGTFRWNDYTIDAYGISSKTEPYSKSQTLNTVSFYAPDPFWRKQVAYTQTETQYIGEEDDVKTYAYGGYNYNYNYTGETGARFIITNPDVLDSKYILTVYGPAYSPALSIGDTNISFPGLTVPQDAYLIVNSMLKTAILHRVDGTEINCFGKRDPDNYLWDPIAYGQNRVSWDGTFTFDIQLIEERSEPKWLTA